MSRNHKSHFVTALAVLFCGAVLAGCSTSPARQISDGFEASRPTRYTAPPPQNGAIFQAGYEVSLYEDMRARRVGDILTIILTERTNASKQAATSTAKDSSVNIASPTLFGREFKFDLPRPFNPSAQNATLANSLTSSNSFTGEGDSAQSNSLTGSITVTVAEVLPNGNLFVKGQKRLTINQGDEYVQFSGIVRTADINPDNSVFSTKVADSNIAYVGDGLVAEANSQGWLARFFNTKWWPF
jgi:flagellar L-ring protein precursor FlgH